MTGRGRGFCVLKLPTEPGEAVTGIAGRSGRPVGWPVGQAMGAEAELARLRSQAGRIEAMLRAVRSRIELLAAHRPARSIGV